MNKYFMIGSLLSSFAIVQTNTAPAKMTKATTTITTTAPNLSGLKLALFTSFKDVLTSLLANNNVSVMLINLLNKEIPTTTAKKGFGKNLLAKLESFVSKVESMEPAIVSELSAIFRLMYSDPAIKNFINAYEAYLEQEPNSPVLKEIMTIIVGQVQQVQAQVAQGQTVNVGADVTAVVASVAQVGMDAAAAALPAIPTPVVAPVVPAA